MKKDEELARLKVQMEGVAQSKTTGDERAAVC